MRFIALTLVLLTSSVFAQAPKLGITDLQAGADAMLTVAQPDEYMDVFRIGRKDVKGVFYGTQYNTHNYSTQDECASALVDTVSAVNEKALKDGATPLQGQEMATRFSSIYDCYELHLDPNVIETNPSPAAAPVPPVAVVPAPPMVPEAVAPVPLTYPDMSKLTMAPPMPVRPYYMAEMVSVPGYPSHWVNYASAYASPSQCWEAVKSFVADRQEEIQKTFVQMSQTYNASEWYRVQMQSLIERRKRLSCVVTSS